MEKVLAFLIYFIIISLILRYSIYYSFKSFVGKWLFLVIWSISLTCYSLFFLNRTPITFDFQQGIINYFCKSSNKYDELLKNINEHFTLIDISGAKSIINDPIIPQKKHIITNRKIIAHFIRYIRKSNLPYTMVAIDINFKQPSENDSILNQELILLKDKIGISNIILANDFSESYSNNIVYKSLDSCLADATEQPIRETFFTHEVIHETTAPNRSIKGMPYMLYNHITETKFNGWANQYLNIYKESNIKKKHQVTYGLNYFIPTLYNNSEKTSFFHELQSSFQSILLNKTINESTSETNNLLSSDDYTYHSILAFDTLMNKQDSLYSEMSIQLLKTSIEQNTTGKKIIFIGEFAQTDETGDLHATSVGHMQGSKIILNSYFNLYNERNKNITLKFLFLITIIIFSNAFIVFKSEIAIIFKKLNVVSENNILILHIKKFTNRFRATQLVNESIDFLFFEEKHYWIAFLLFYLFFKFTGSGYILAIIPLFILFVILEILVNFHQSKKQR